MVRVSTGFLFIWLLILPCLLYGQPHKILCIGNSITQADENNTSYRFPLWKKLVDAGIAIEFVGSHDRNKWDANSPVQGASYKDETFTNVNEGHWGWRVDQLLNGHEDERYKGKLADWVQNYTVDYALVHMGTNDIFQGQNTSETIHEVEQVIQTLREKNNAITILLAQLIPSKKQDATNDSIQAYNNKIKTLGNDLDSPASKVVVVDMYTGFDETVLLYDDAHPNEQGEEVMAQRWYDALSPLIIKPLPVTLVDFKARPVPEGGIKLDWKTASEQNNDFFELQRAQNPDHFTSITKIKGAGTTQTSSVYTHHDALAPAGQLYYRLKQVDTNGKVHYSKTIFVMNTTQSQALYVYPTTTQSENITILLQHQQPHTPVEVTIYAANGTVVSYSRETSNSAGSFTRKVVPDALWGQGLYFVRVAVNGKHFQSKFIVSP